MTTRGTIVSPFGVIVVCTLSCGPTAGPDTFIALQRDFASFQTWKHFTVGDAPLAGHPPGPRVAYLNHKPPAGSREYPVGTIIVKTVEPPGLVAPKLGDLC